MGHPAVLLMTPPRSRAEPKTLLQNVTACVLSWREAQEVSFRNELRCRHQPISQKARHVYCTSHDVLAVLAATPPG